MAGLLVPLSTLRPWPRDQTRMTRGQCGSLLLHCNGLSPSTPCRSPGAHPVTDPASPPKSSEIKPLRLAKEGSSVKTAERRLYLVLGDGTALRYAVAVGRPGKQWQGSARVNGKHVLPAWTPPAEVRADNPALPEVIPGGAPNNPMGVAAMTLSGGEYAIHGTNRPDSIGKSASYGCIRMLNDDIADLFERVAVGTQVVVLR